MSDVPEPTSVNYKSARFSTVFVPRLHAYDLAKALNECPADYHLHSVIPIATTQHGHSYLIVVFEKKETLSVAGIDEQSIRLTGIRGGDK